MIPASTQDVSQASEARNIATGKGRWGDPAFPKTGWRCIAVVDLLQQSLRCEACQSSLIRFAHLLVHPDLPRQYQVGCICAGHLIGDMGKAQAGDAQARALSGKRSRWITRKWRMTRAGNWCLKYEGAWLTVFENGGRYSASYRVPGQPAQFLNARYSSPDEAKLAAFDAWVGNHPSPADKGNAEAMPDNPKPRAAVMGVVEKLRTFIRRFA